MENPANAIVDTMWNFVKDGQQKENIPALKDAVYTLIGAMTQKTAGQRKDKSKDFDFRNLEMLKWDIIIGATTLVLSKRLDSMEDTKVTFIKEVDASMVSIYKCDCCHADFYDRDDNYQYCPYCGRKVDNEDE